LPQNDHVLNHASIRMRTTAYAAEPRDVIISFRMTRAMADGIDSFGKMYQKKSRTEGIIDLLGIALFVVDNFGRLQDPDVVKYLQQNLYNVQLVDDIMEWPQDRIEAIMGALFSERERRLRLKIAQK
jgi:hypothetical protein